MIRKKLQAKALEVFGKPNFVGIFQGMKLFSHPMIDDGMLLVSPGDALRVVSAVETMGTMIHSNWPRVAAARLKSSKTET